MLSLMLFTVKHTFFVYDLPTLMFYFHTSRTDTRSLDHEPSPKCPKWSPKPYSPPPCPHSGDVDERVCE